MLKYISRYIAICSQCIHRNREVRGPIYIYIERTLLWFGLPTPLHRLTFERILTKDCVFIRNVLWNATLVTQQKNVKRRVRRKVAKEKKQI